MHFLLLPFRLIFVFLKLVLKTVFHIIRVILLAIGYIIHQLLRGIFIILGFSDDIPIAIFSALTRFLQSPRKFFSSD